MKKSRRNTRVSRAKSNNKISMKALKQLVLEEVSKMTGELEPVEDVSAEEVDADGYADTLEQHINVYKAMKAEGAKLKRQHAKLVKEARRIRRNKQIAKKKILKNLK